jgi:hypothetical protein
VSHLGGVGGLGLAVPGTSRTAARKAATMASMMFFIGIFPSIDVMRRKHIG